MEREQDVAIENVTITYADNSELKVDTALVMYYENNESNSLVIDVCNISDAELFHMTMAILDVARQRGLLKAEIRKVAVDNSETPLN